MNTSNKDNPASRTSQLVLVHGRGYKPQADILKRLWTDSLRAGLARDFPGDLERFDNLHISMVYYGDLINAFLTEHGKTLDAKLDEKDRQKAFGELAALGRAKRFRRVYYDELPGKTSLGEFIADIGMPLAHTFGLGARAMHMLLPELVSYWQDTNGFAEALDQRMTGGLTQAFASGGSVMLVAHCMGSVAAYNALWTLSRELKIETKVDRLVTLGSPLADETVKRRLKGFDHSDASRYPGNIVHWTNVSAEDDYICHDETVANDFSGMVSALQISRIEDVHIYNLAVRYGRSNPHSAIGYLIHPRMAQLLSTWLQAPA